LDVLDLFAGSGTIEDCCRYYGHKCYSYDLSPQRRFIQRYDVRAGIPNVHDIDLAFIDPSWFNVIYKNGGLGSLSFVEYLDAMSSIAIGCKKVLIDEGIIALFIGEEYKRNNYLGICNKVASRFEEHYTLLDEIIVITSSPCSYRCNKVRVNRRANLFLFQNKWRRNK
jgi:hypothetical protein